ncbi:MAG: AMP-binding protein [Deltaproteobacteria bacterium]|jgi:phenylacetate-coenzyme A ligase PaaK-like adenylate-forming protein|nr:AMP-binding protein [Deltaproteobacteria bacterium]
MTTELSVTNRLDLLFDLIYPGPDSRALRLSRYRALKLAQSLTYAANFSPWYKRQKDTLLKSADLLSKAHDRDKEPKLWEDLITQALEPIAFLSESELAREPERFLAVSQNEVEGVVTVPTSASSGPAKRIFSSQSDLYATTEFFRYGMLHLLDPLAHEKVALLMSGSRPGSVGDLLTRALSYWQIPVYVPGFIPSEKTKEFIHKILDFNPTSLVGLPSQLIYLARTSGAIKGLKSILLSGESAPQSLKSALSSIMGIKVFTHYGLTEFGLGGAVECPHLSGPHLREADIICEIIDPNDSNLEDGKSGEIVLTSLNRLAMPLFRYRTGDFGILTSEPCPCGSSMRRLKVLGRLSDGLTRGLTGGNSDSPLNLASLGEAIYKLPFVTCFRAAIKKAKNSPFKGPFLAVTLGLNSPSYPDDWLIEAREAIDGLLGSIMPFEVKFESNPQIPAANGAKPTIEIDLAD